MPNRILRDWTDSFTINTLDANAERFFTRLIMKADDFGRFHADTRLLRAYLFPLLPEIRETDITHWIAACEKAGVLRCYVDGKGRKFMEIGNFKQRTRQSESKFPGPDSEDSTIVSTEEGKGKPNDGHSTVKRRSSDRQARTYSETKTETDSETKTNSVSAEAETGPTNDQPDHSPSSEPAGQQADPLYQSFSAAYLEATQCPYLSKRGDFVQMAELKKKSQKNNWPLTPERISQAIGNYFSSEVGHRTFADFCSKFTTYWAMKLDRYNKPMEAANGNHKTHAIPGGNRGGDAGESQFRAKRQI